MSTRADETRRIVDKLDETKNAEYFRNPDRPGAVRRSQPRDPAVIRAQSRLRVAAWRVEQDRKRAPTVNQIGMRLAVALATMENLDQLNPGDPGIVGRMLLDLQSQGFDVGETLATLKRLRKRLRDRVAYSLPVESGATGPGRR